MEEKIFSAQTEDVIELLDIVEPFAADDGAGTQDSLQKDQGNSDMILIGNGEVLSQNSLPEDSSAICDDSTVGETDAGKTAEEDSAIKADMEIFLSLLSELSHKLEDQEHRYQSIVQTMQQRITALENALQTGDVQNSRQRIQDMELRMDTWEEGEERRVAAAAARVIREEIAAMRADTGK